MFQLAAYCFDPASQSESSGTSTNAAGNNSLTENSLIARKRPAVRHPDRGVGRIFGQQLPARAAGHRPARRARDDGHGDEVPLAGGQRVEQRHALGAAGQPVAGALHVGARDDLAGPGEERRADFELRIRRHRALPRLGGRPHQITLTGSWPYSFAKFLSNSRCHVLDPLRGLQHLGVRQRLPAPARRQVGDAGYRGHLQTALPRHNRLRHRAHADGVRAEPGERANLRRRFVARPAHRQVSARPQLHAARPARPPQQAAQARVVGASQINKARQAGHRPAPQRVGAHQVDVVCQHHEIARAEAAVHAPRGIGEQQVPDAIGRQRAHRERHQRHRVPLVIMRPAAQHHHRRAAQMADEQLPRVAAHARGRKPRQPAVGNLRVHPQLAQHVVKAAAQHQRQRRPQPGQLLQPRRRGPGIRLSFAHSCSILQLI